MTVSGGLHYSSNLRDHSLITLTGAGGAGDKQGTPVPAWAREIAVTFLTASETLVNADIFTITSRLSVGGVLGEEVTPRVGETLVTSGDMFDDQVKLFNSPSSEIIVGVTTAILPDGATASFAVTFSG